MIQRALTKSKRKNRAKAAKKIGLQKKKIKGPKMTGRYDDPFLIIKKVKTK